MTQVFVQPTNSPFPLSINPSSPLLGGVTSITTFKHPPSQLIKLTESKKCPRYSRSLTKNRKQYLQDTVFNAYDPKPMEKQILNGSRLKFNGDLSMNLYQDEPKQQLLLPILFRTESVKVGSITISKDVALPKYLDPPKSKRVGFKKLPEYSIRRFSHVDDLVERVRLQQVDILKKYQAKSFSKDIQNKLKDELFIILKQFE